MIVSTSVGRANEKGVNSMAMTKLSSSGRRGMAGYQKGGEGGFNKQSTAKG